MLRIDECTLAAGRPHELPGAAARRWDGDGHVDMSVE